MRLTVGTLAAVVWTVPALAPSAARAHHPLHFFNGGLPAFGFMSYWNGLPWYPGFGYFGPSYYGLGYQVPPSAPAPGPLAPAPRPADDAPRKRQPRVSNASALGRAKEFLKFGDKHFRAQEFSEAYQRYKKAASAAPDVADARFRQGFSLLALGNYESAYRAIVRGLALKPDWARSKFRLDDLYGPNRLAKANHLEQLATAAANEPENAALMFLLGLELYFDDQAERSRKFFVRAAELGAEPEYLEEFFDALGPVRGEEPAEAQHLGRMEL